MKQTLITEINQKLQDAEIKIFTNDNKYFNAIIISNDFLNKELIERQRIIYNIIGDYITNKTIHAISFKTYTKDEWDLENKN
ncbi:MAG TPA: BolA/IbaG family iron-sulfur metabolism protein [Candidatus Azoamicus sp.]